VRNLQNLLTIVGERIRYFRKNRRLTQEQLGQKVGLPQSYIGGVERGERNLSLETLERIIEALHLGAGEVFIPVENKEQLKKDKLIDLISLKLKERDLSEIETIYTLIQEVLKAIDIHSKPNK
jgi:transcriptional regulator with XRE-family HTH domain